MPRKPATDDTPEEPAVEPIDAEPSKESNETLDEPVVSVPVPAGGGPIEVGSYIGTGVDHVARAGGEWEVDPQTGLVTKEISAPVADPDADPAFGDLPEG